MEVQDKLRAVYDRLKSNPNISGLPDEYDKFKNAFLDKDKAKTIYERLKSEKTVSGLPDSFESFYSIVPSESIQNKIESDTAKSVENAQYGSNAAEKKGFWDSYMGDLLEKAGAGASAFGASVYSALEHFNNTVLKPWELPSASDGNLDLSDKPELQGVLDKMGVPENERRLTDERSWMKSEADNAYQYAETLRNRSDRYNGKSFRDLWKEGDYLGVVGDVFLQASESLPQSLVAMFGGAAGLALTGVLAGTQKYDELDKMPETKDLPEYQKVINAISTGAFEYLSELLGDIPIGNWIKGLYSKVGAREGEKVLKNGFQRFFDGLFKKYGVLFAPVAEGAEEVASQIAENATDYFTGVSEELNLFDGVPESFVYGAGGGAQFSLGGIPGVIKRKHERRKVNKDFDTAREAVKESFPGGKADSFVDEIYSLPRVEQEEIITNLLNSQDLNDEQKNALVNLYSIMDLHKAYNTPEAITLEKVYGRFEKFRNNKSGDIVTARDSEGNPLYVLDETEKGSLVLKNDGTKVFIPSSELKDVKSESVDEHVNAFMANYLNAGRDLQSGETNAGMSMEGVNSEMAGENNDVSYNGYPVQVLESSVREDGTVLVEDANGETMRVPANELTDSNVAEPSSNSVQPADDSNMSPEENVVPAESMQPEIPLTKEGLPDYDSMPAEMFAEEFEKEFGAEETKAELEQMVTDVDAKIEKLRKKAPTDRNARAENKREILRLTKERENVLQALERYVPKQSAEEEIIGTVPEEMLMEEERLSTEQADEQVEDRQGTEEIKPVGEGFFGDIYDQFRGKAKEAVNFLMSRKEGEAIGALYHKDIGDIDLVWGNEKAGLMKIARKHPEMLEDLQSKLDAMDVVSSSDNRIILESPVDRAVVSKNVFDEKDKQWLLTAYEKKNANISGSSIDIEPEPEGKQNGTAPLQNESVSSETKVTGIPGEKQGEPEESAEQKILNLGKESVFLPYNKENRDEISEQISQGEYRAEAKEVGGMEETLSELKRRSKENEGDAQEAGGTLSGRQQKEIEARVAEAYAKEKGIWIPMQEIFSLGDPAPGGNENDVYFNSQDNSVYKVNNLMNSGNITSLLERIKLHNQYFPDTRYELVGFSGFGGRDIYPVLRQRYIENSTFATPEEIDRYMQSLGFEQTGEAEYSGGDVVISDLRPRNVLKDTDGDIYVVDAEFKKKESENSREDGKSADGDAALFREVENYTPEENIEEVNRRFNEELEGLTEKNADRVILYCGNPSVSLLRAGIPDRNIALYGNKLLKKAKQHEYDIRDVKNLPSYIQTPIAVFKGSYNGSFAILTEMPIHGKNTLVSVDVNKGEVQDLNLVTSVFDKNNKGIIDWINEGKLLFEDKEKALNYLSSSALIADATNNSELSSATNIIENFENPIFPEREVLSEADKYTPEEQAVISRAQKEGTYMKAPNGKPSNLNEKQWAQVRTKAFKDWFGDWENDPKNASKVVDENGEPRVVFHGAPSIFNTFDTHRIGSNTGTADGWGFYFTTDKDHAEGFGTADGRVIEAFLNIRNPLDYSKKTISKLKLREIVKEIDRQEYANEGVHYFLSNYGDYTRGLSRVVDEAVNSEYEYSDNDVELVNSMIAGSGSVELIMNAVEKLTGKSSMIAPKSNGAVHYIVTSPNQIKSATDNSGEFSKENNDIRFREVDDRDVSSFAKKYGFDKEDVKKYAYGMQSGNLGGASYALKNIRRKARLDNDVSSLGEFVKLFSPIQNELFEKFGSVDVLREEQEKTHMDQVNMMEAARKRAEEEAAAERKRLDEFELMSDEQLDSEYFKALEANNEGRMRDLVNEAARRNGYVSSDEFRMAHRAPSYDEEGYDKSMIDVAKNKDDIRESLNEQFRMNRDRSRNESVIAIENALSAIDRGEEPTVTIYRAAPKSLKEGKVRNGDWVTLSKSYAKQHGNHALDGNYRIMKEEVPVENLYWDGNDMNEWGYDDRSDYRYRDVKNNRKLNDLITRDDSGNVIPLSERFNSRKNDPRFRQNESSGMSIAEVNRRFNEELEQQINSKLPKGHVYQLGRPGKELKSAGIPDLPIELVASRLSLKASEAYESDHPFELSEVKNLPEAIQNPIAVFDSKTRAGSKVIMTELTDTKGHHFVVAMNTNVPVNQYARRTLQINSIRSVYPKDNIRDIVNWINRGDLLKWSDKTKLGNWLTQQRSNSADVAMSVSELNVATNIIENFKNPTILEGEISSEIDQISGELGVKVNKVQSRKDLPDGIQRQMKNGRYPGLFDPKTGEVYMVMDEIIDVADAQATMLHEIVGHKGIRGLFGKKIGEFTNRVLDSMPENERQEWIKKYNGNEQLAAEEYVARFAEGYENPGVWEKIKAIFRELLHDFGIDLKLSDNDLKYILWRGVKSMQQDGTFIKTAEYIAKDRKMQQTLFREAQPDDEFADKHLSLGERAREAFQDRMLSVKLLLDEVKKRGGKVTDYANPYVAENLTTSKSKAQIDDFNKRLWQPLMNHIKEFTDKGKTREEVDHYMMAKHAPERNALLSERDGVENGSGITNEDAAKVVSEFEKDFSKERIDEFWDSVREATRFTIDTWQKHGLIDRTTKDYYDSMYQYYVPLRGWEESEADNIEYLDGLRRGSIVNVNKKAKGRSSLADSPLAYIANMAHSAIVAGNKNDVKRNVFEMMALNKNPDLYHLKKVYYVNTGTKESPVWVEQLEKPATELWNEGRVKVDVSRKNEAKRESYKTKQHQVEVFVNGQKYIMEFNGNMGVRVANAINGVNVIHSELLQNSMGRITRWMTANYTSKNPEFVVTNFLRDFGYAIPAYWMKGGKAGVLLKNMPKAFKAIHNDISGRKVDSDLQEMYEEFKINGGLTGYVHMTDIDSYKKWIERDIRRMSGDKTFGDVVLRNKAMRAGADLLEYLAQMSENSTRFAVYMSERQEGRSVTEAAYAAKEITTNFNRKGRCSSVLGSLYGFFNATVQGSANALGLAKQSPGKFGIYCGSLIALQLLSSSLCRMMGGEDETGENNYDRLADWVKYNNLVLPDIGHKGRFITIPLPHFFRALSSLGVIAGEVWNGAKMPDKGLEAMFDAVSGDLTPVEIATPQFKNLPSFLMSVTPTGLKPITEAYAFNRNFMNLPVSREAMGDQKKTLPQHRLAKKTTNPTLVGISRWLNEAGGGGEHTTAEITYDKDTGEVGRNEWKTWMDVNPAKFEHVVEGVFGGRLKFFNNLYKTVDNATKGEFEPSTTPVLRPLYQSPKGESAWIKFYEVRDEVIDIDAKASEFMKTRNYDAYGMVNYRNARLVETYKAYESIVKTLNDVLKTVSDPEQIAEIEKQKNEVVKEFAIEAKKLEKEYQKSKKKKELVK